MINVFIGFDERQRVSFTTLASSIYELSSAPVSVSPLVLRTLPISRRGLTPFTFSRFLVPWLTNYSGKAIFMDADMLLTSDICEVMDTFEDSNAVAVVKSIAEFERSSFMVFNCEHSANRLLTPDYVQNTTDNLLALEWLTEDIIGTLDPKWNQLIGYQAVDPSAGCLHYTMGIPAYPETATCEHGNYWAAQLNLATSSAPWAEIMGDSVHAVGLNDVKLPRYVWDFETNKPKPEHLELIKSFIGKDIESKQN